MVCASVWLLGLAAAVCAESGPLLECGVNGARDAQVTAGTPVVLQALAIAAEGPLRLQTAGTVTLRVQAGDGSPVEWPWRIARADAARELARFDAAEAVWTLSPQFTQELGAGLWRVRAVLDTTRDTPDGAWRGRVESAECTLRVTPPPAEESLDEFTRRKLLQSDYEELNGDLLTALAEVDGLLARAPSSIAGLLRKGDLLVRQEQPAEALEIYHAAERIFVEQDESKSHPPLLIRRRITEAQARLFPLE
jgi:hypothetical protein